MNSSNAIHQKAAGPLQHYARASAAAKHFQIARSTLWQWTKSRQGFPQPLKAGEKVTLFDINAIDAYLKAQAAK